MVYRFAAGLVGLAAAQAALVAIVQAQPEKTTSMPGPSRGSIGADFTRPAPCIPKIIITPTGQLVRQGCGNPAPAPLCSAGVLNPKDLAFRIRSFTFGADGSVSGEVEATVAQCDASGSFEVTQMSLGTNRWQYRPGRDNRNAVYAQNFASVQAQPFIKTYSHSPGTPTVIPFRFIPLAADHVLPQASPVGSVPYCAYQAGYVHLAYRIGTTTLTAEPEFPFPHAVQYGRGAPSSCPLTTAQACLVDPRMAASETCHPALRAGAFCLSSYEGGWLESHDFCGNAQSFAQAMVGAWAVDPAHAFVRDWVNLGRDTAVGEFKSTGNVAGDSVDIAFVSTHGGVSETDAFLALWPANQDVWSNADGLRFGEFPGRLSVLVLSSCWVLSDSAVPTNTNAGHQYDGSGSAAPETSGFMFNRWGNAFKGGLRIAVGGANGETYSDGIISSTDDNPGNFVQNMKNRPILNAFLDAWENWDVDQHVGGIASGRTPIDCMTRLLSLRFDKLNDFPRLYDADVQYLCQVHEFHDSIWVN
jgi:hypothetical protein